MADALYARLAEILDYPGPGLGARVDGCVATLRATRPEAARRLEEFARAVATAPAGRLEESYAAAFDLDPSCSPHVGYRLLGPDPRRGVFLARLAGRYRARGVSAGRELPDHAAVLLRFLAHAPDEPGRDELVGDCLVPALATLAQELGRRRHPYAAAVDGIRLVLEADAREEARP